MSRKLPDVELFVSDNDPSGYGEGQQFLSDATADGAGNFTLSICGTSLLAGTKVTATATDALGNTSESSLNYTITAGSGACPTPTPSPSPTLSPTPTATPVPTPTATPTQVAATPTPSATEGSQRFWGDGDCDGEISSRDNQALLRAVLSQAPLSQTEPCPDLGDSVTADGTTRIWGDWDCDGELSSRDNQALLRAVLTQAALSQTEPCPDVGTGVEVIA